MTNIIRAALICCVATASAEVPPISIPVRPAQTAVTQSAESPVQPWQSATRIRIRGSEQDATGSGVVIYSNEAETILITAAHLIQDDAKEVIVDFYEGKLIKSENGPGRVRYASSAYATFFQIDRQSDLALVRAFPNKLMPASPIVALGWEPSLSESMIAVGCSDGGAPTLWNTQIERRILRDIRIQGMFLSDYTAYECTYAPRQGRSGGGLFTPNGFLVGINNFALYKENKGLYALAGSIRRILLNSQYAFLVQDRL